MIKLASSLLILMAPQKAVIGRAEYCAIATNEIQCVDHTLAQCLRTAYLMPTAYLCVKRSEVYETNIVNIIVRKP